ncbi:MAG TPA: C4-type zinc ribbon domain-containing protein [Nocardioidaceae bacterium]|nr:C4-type zinc ribbon domain-containing protein [Nocardioidaceae bacterium]
MLTELEAERTAVDGRLRDARIRVDDLTREQKRADADVEQVKGRRTRDRDRMDRGLVANPKDLERMQSELVSLDRRISDLEDAELDVMERLETAQGELASLGEQSETLEARAAELVGLRDAKAGEVAAESGQLVKERATAADGVPADLLALYEKVRGQKGGVGAAALRARRCGGCSLELTAASLAEIAKASSDEVLRCEECSRILVRTAESGL